MNPSLFYYMVITFINALTIQSLRYQLTFKEAGMKTIKKSVLIALFFFLPFCLRATEIQVKVIKSAEDLPEQFCSLWQKGDFLLSDGKTLIIIGASSRSVKTMLNYPSPDVLGSIISFVPAGKNLESNLVIGSPVLRRKDRREELAYASIQPLKETEQGAAAFEALSSYQGKKGEKAEIKTLYSFYPDEAKIDISSTLTNTGEKELEDVNSSLYFNPLHSYSFSPFHREKHPNLSFRVYQKNGYYLAWLDMNPPPKDEESPSRKLQPGKAFKIHYILLVSTQFEDLLQRAYGVFKVKPLEALIHFKDFSSGLTEVIIVDAFSPSLFFRSMLENPLSLRVPLPQGVYKVRANFFPAVCEELLVVAEGEESSCILQNPPQGRVKVRIRDSRGEFVPGKVTFIGLSPTRTPFFKPENPVKSGKQWETFKNSCFPQEEGLELRLPVGTYLIYASRGPEYSMDQKIIEVLKDELQELVFRIDRVLETPNLISLDPHLHTTNSDGRVSISERIKSIVAEGVDVTVATDHNFISDYTPALKKLGVEKYLTVVCGNEVTHPDNLIHYNTYPLKLRADEERNGAIHPFAEEAPLLFEASRKKDPEAILQVNHPRAGDLGYFNNYQLDEEQAAFAREYFSTSFDLLEVMNGPHFYSSNSAAIEDWFHLLDRGYYFPLIGSSDTHSIDREEPGYSRTYVFYEGQGGDRLNWAALALSLKKGRSFTTNGPLVEFKVNGKYTSGDTLTAKDGRVELWIKVQSAPWIAVDEVRVIVNGERKIIFPVKTAKEVVSKFEDQVSLRVNKDSYFAVEVLGKESLYPVLQRSSPSGFLSDANLPYALTNPVFVDFDGNGKFDAPLPHKINLTSEILPSKELISRY